MFMKKILLAAVMVCFAHSVFAFSIIKEPKHFFKLNDLNGRYAYSLSGSATLTIESDKIFDKLGLPIPRFEIPSVIPVREVGIIVADGKGNLRADGKMVLLGRVVDNSYDCTYRRDPDVPALAAADCELTSTTNSARSDGGMVEVRSNTELSFAVDHFNRETRFVMKSLHVDNSPFPSFPAFIDVGGSARKQ
jgi:hypothetical protein